MPRICLCCGKKLEDSAPYSWHSSCIRRFFGSDRLPEIDLDDAIADSLAKNNVSQGNVVTGVQKKLSVTLSHPGNRKTVPYGVEYIIKTGDGEKPYLPEYEFVGMALASLCGFKTVPFGLIRSRQGTPIYICRRIDRAYQNGTRTKIPMEDFAQLSLMQTEYKYDGSYEGCAKQVIDRFSSNPTLDKIEFFRMVFFSYLIGNTDMHRKNYSLYDTGKGYVLTPFYDILPVLMVVSQTEMALTIHGKRKNVTLKDFLLFGESIGIQRTLGQKLVRLILGKVDAMKEFVLSAPLPEEKKKGLIALIEKRSLPFLSGK